MILYPYPQSLIEKDGTADYSRVSVVFDPSLKREEYKLSVSPEGVSITAQDEEGEARARATLKQMKRSAYGKCAEIHDWPSIPHRSVMLDISRSKIPSVRTLCRLIDWFEELKYNELQLYIEGYPFAYAHFPEVWKNFTPLTPEDIRFLDAYAKKHYITLIANQNCFGHMSPWLFVPELNHLAECPDGFDFKWDHWGPTCLSPADPEAFEFVKTLFDDLLPNFSSDTVNINCDETLELGLGKSKALCEEKGTERVYIEFMKRVIEYVKKYKKNVMFWGDIIAKAPELLTELPENVIPIAWGYSRKTPDHKQCEAFQKIGMPFYCSPGTQSWCTILGNVGQMMDNVDHAVEGVLKYGGIGLMMTDWGDLNHPQYLPFSYPGFAYAAARAWNSDRDAREELPDYLDEAIFLDKNKKFARLMMDAGRYLEHVDFSATERGFIIGLLFYPLDDKVMAKNLSDEEMKKLEAYLAPMAARLEECDMACDDADLIRDEFLNALRIMTFTAEAGRDKLGLYHGGTQESHRAYLKELQTPILSEHRRLWRARNNESGLAASVDRIKKVEE